MTLTQIKYVVETANAKSISKAAANLFISQSVVSTAISNLEKEVGEQIFVRNSSGIRLTPFGKTFVSYLVSIQDQLDQLNRVVVQKAGQSAMSFSVANISYPFIISACTALLEHWGKTGIRISQYDEDEMGVINLVSSRIAEIGILRTWSCYKSSVLNQLKAQHLQYFPLAKLEVGITVGPNNPLYHSDRNYVSLTDLTDYPAVVYRSTDTGPYSDIFKQLHFPYAKSRIITTSRAAIAEIIQSTNAYMLDTSLPLRGSEYWIGFDARRTLLLKETNIYSEMGWIKRKDYSATSIAAEFIDLITSYFQ